MIAASLVRTHPSFHAASSLHAVIQAGGQGQRLRSIAGTTAKPMMQVGDEPMVGRLIRQLAASGVPSATVVIPADNDRFKNYLLQLYSRESPLLLDVIEEPVPLGNGGALAAIERRDRPLLFCFGDLVTDLPFNRMAELHQQRGCDVTLASHYEHHQLSLGELLTEGERVEGYVEKPRKRFLICSGIAIFEPKILSLARTLATPFGLVDLINACLQAGFSVTHWMHEAYWIDVNTPELLQQAREDANKLSTRSSQN